MFLKSVAGNNRVRAARLTKQAESTRSESFRNFRTADAAGATDESRNFSNFSENLNFSEKCGPEILNRFPRNFVFRDQLLGVELRVQSFVEVWRVMLRHALRLRPRQPEVPSCRALSKAACSG